MVMVERVEVRNINWYHVFQDYVNVKLELMASTISVSYLVPLKGKGCARAGAADEGHGRRGRGGKERQGQGDLDGGASGVDVSGHEGHGR